MYAGVHRLQIPHRAHELLPVVPAGAADDLAVHDDAVLGKAAHHVDRLAGALVFQHPAAKLGVRGVHRNIDRTDVQSVRLIFAYC